MIDGKLFKEMIKSQLDLNDLTYPNWQNSNLDWSRAIMDEISEALNSFQWKWWKGGKIDRENLIVEVVDILHFAISKSYINNEKNLDDICKYAQDSYDKVMSRYVSSDNQDSNDKFVEKILLENWDYSNCKNPEVDFCGIAVALLRILNLSFDDIYRKYMIKNTLNIFRINNGYANGTYIKMWKVSDTMSREDNEIAMNLGMNTNVDTNFKEKLYKNLENIYASFKD